MTTSCFICGIEQSFDSIARHEKTCLNSSTQNDISYTKMLDEYEMKKRKQTKETSYVSCELCGKVFSVRSVGFHLKSCEKMHLEEHGRSNRGSSVAMQTRGSSVVARCYRKEYHAVSNMRKGGCCCPKHIAGVTARYGHL